MINKTLKIVLIALFWFLLMLIQTSFISIFTDFNFIVLLIVIINLIENPESNFGLLSAFLAGIFLDFNTTYYFGIFTLGLVLFSLTAKIVLLKFLKIPYVSFIPKI
ncbi:MAG: hypothetical protein PHY30_03285 [Candidatus Pacebacteria bacterium]|nr:hypothetical protein [Candidatus Paceibacterota bacterium]